MKKIISLILVVLCVFSLFACGDKDSSDVWSKLSHSGKKVDRIKALDYIEDREVSYAESDMAQLESLNAQWFNVDAKYQLKSNTDFYATVSETIILFEMSGTIGLFLNGELAMDVAIVYEENFEKQSEKIDVDEENKVEAHIIVCDGVMYADYKTTSRKEGKRETNQVKVMMPIDELNLHDINIGNLDIDNLGQIAFEDFYGTGVYKLTRTFINIELEREADFYLSNDKVFLEIDSGYEDDEATSSIFSQLEVEFVSQSAFVKALRYYNNTKSNIHIDKYLSECDTKIGFIIAQCEAKTIIAPDTKGYEQA